MKVFDKIILARKVADDARSKINEVTGLLKECFIECDKCAALKSGAQPPQADNSQSDAIAFDIEWFRPVLEKYLDMDLVPIALLEMISVAQQHT